MVGFEFNPTGPRK